MRNSVVVPLTFKSVVFFLFQNYVGLQAVCAEHGGKAIVEPAIDVLRNRTIQRHFTSKKDAENTTSHTYLQVRHMISDEIVDFFFNDWFHF